MTSEGQSVAGSSRHYSKAPIVEAVINIQVAYPKSLDRQLIALAQDRFASRFAHSRELDAVNLMVGPSEPSAAKAMLGVRFANTENTKILQIRQEGFAYSHLTPYSKWETLRAEAFANWNEFLTVCGPTRVTRIAVKFVNRLVFPHPEGSDSVDLDDFLAVHPVVPNFGEAVSGFMTQVQIPQPSLDGQRPLALVTVASQPPTKPNSETAVLDIDVFESVDWQTTDERIWAEIDKMRFIKNMIFEGSLTAKLKETYL
jgi:uncharacterized protein (TIGR04255 family)